MMTPSLDTLRPYLRPFRADSWHKVREQLDHWQDESTLTQALTELRLATQDWPAIQCSLDDHELQKWSQENFIRHSAIAAESCSITGFFIQHRDTQERFCSTKWAQSIRHIHHTHGTLSTEIIDCLARSPQLTQITSLHIESNALTVDILRHILEGPIGRQLEQLLINNNSQLGDDALEYIAEATHLTSLRVLSMRSCQLTERGVKALANATHLDKLELLRLDWNNIGAGIQALFDASWFEHLKGLDISGHNKITAPLLKTLRERTTPTQLEYFYLDNNPIGDEGVEYIASSPALSNLRVLSLSDNQLTDRSLQAIASSPHFHHLEALVLGGFSSFQRQHLLRHNPLDSLHVLKHLKRSGSMSYAGGGNNIGVEGCKALATTNHLPNLRYLTLSQNPLTDEGVEALAHSQQFVHLEHLELSDVHLTAKGLRQLRQAKAFPNLIFLKAENKSLGEQDLLDARWELFQSPHYASLTYLVFSWSHNYHNHHIIGRLLRADPSLLQETTLSLDLETKQFQDRDIELLIQSPLLANIKTFRWYNIPVSPKQWRALLDSPLFEGLQTLALGTLNVGSAGIKQLVEASSLKGLTQLVLYKCELTPEDLDIILHAPFAKTLQTLRVRHNPLKNAATAFIDSPVQDQLKKLDVCDCQLTEDDLLTISSIQWKQLEDLRLQNNHSTNRTRRALLQAPHLRGLRYLEHQGHEYEWEDLQSEDYIRWIRHEPVSPSDITLDLSIVELDEEDVRHILTHPSIAQIQEIILTDNELDPAVISVITDSDVLPQLRRLAICSNPIGDIGSKIISQSPRMLQLDDLSLVACQIGNTGIKALSTSPYLKNIRSLSLEGNNFDESAKQFLLRSTQLSALEELDLGEHTYKLRSNPLLLALKHSPLLSKYDTLSAKHQRLDDASVQHILASPHLSHLRHIELSNNILSDSAALAIADSEQLRNLETLDISSNPYDRTQHKITDIGLYALAHSPNLTNLKVLRIDNHNITASGLQDFLRHSVHTKLEELSLKQNQIQTIPTPILQTYSPLTSLQTLHLEKNQLSADNILQLQHTTHLLSLRELHYTFDHLDTDQLSQLAFSPNTTSTQLSKILKTQPINQLRVWAKKYYPLKLPSKRKLDLINAMREHKSSVIFPTQENAPPIPPPEENATLRPEKHTSTDWNELRDLLATPSSEQWVRVCVFLEAWPDNATRSMAHDYANSHLHHWPADICRFGLSSAAHFNEERLPPYWPSVRCIQLLKGAWNSSLLEHIVTAPQFEQIEILSLDQNYIDLEGLQTLARSPYSHNLKSLSLRENLFSDEDFVHIAKLPFISQLRALDISDNQISKDGLEALSQHSQLTQLTSLKLERCLTTRGALQVLQDADFPSLETLSLAGNGLGPEDLQALGKARFSRQLKHLSLSDCSLQDDTFEVLAELELPSLETLDLRDNPLEENGLKALIKGQEWPQLRSLQIRHKTLRPSDIRSLLRAPYPALECIEWAQKMYNTKTLTRSEPIFALFHPRHHADTLERRTLAGLELTDHELIYLIEQERLSGVKQLDLRNNQLTKESLTSLERLSQLTHLWLDNNPLEDEGVSTLFDCTFPQLVYVGLAKVGLGDEGCQSLKTLASMPQLHSLVLVGNRFGEQGVNALATLRHVKQLELLDMEGNRLSTESYIALLESQHLSAKVRRIFGSHLTTAQLKQRLKAQGKSGYSRLKKDELIDMFL